MSDQKKKRRRKKPQDRSKLTRNKMVQIRMTAEEVAKLKAAAAAAGMSMADYIMAGIEQSRCVVVPGADDLRKEMVREGRNLNQALILAYRAQKEGQSADLRAIEDAAKKVDETIEKLDGWIQDWNVNLKAKLKGGGKRANTEVQSQQGETVEGHPVHHGSGEDALQRKP